jgi:hypothetical protein
MLLREIEEILDFHVEVDSKLELLFPLFVYSNEFKKLYIMFHDYKFKQYTMTAFNKLDWKLYANGIVGLCTPEIKKIYFKGDFYEGLVAYFDLYKDINRLSNANLLDISNNYKLGFDDIDKKIFLNEFNTEYKYNYNRYYQGMY